MQRHRGGLGDGAPLTPAERLGQQIGRGRRGRAGREEPGQRRLPGLRMHPRVVDLADPGVEQHVELGQAVHRGAGPVGAVDDLDQELVTDGAEKTFDLASTSGFAGLGVGELDPQHRARPAQPGIDEHRPVVHIGLGRAPARGEAVAQGLSQRDRVLRIPPAGRHHRPGMIVEERDEDRLAAGHVRAVQRVTDPAGVGPVGLEPAEHRWRPAVVAWPVEPERGEVSLQRPRRGRPPGVRGQHHRDLRGGPPRRLPLEPDRQLQHLGRGLRSQPPRRRDQRGEPTGPIRPDPAIQIRPTHPHRLR